MPLGRRRLRDLGARARDGVRETSWIDRLEDVVDRVNVERGDGVLIERRHEDHERCWPIERTEHAEAVDARHLHVEQHDVRVVRRDERDRLAAVRRLAHDLDVRLFAEQSTKPLPGERLIVDDEDAQWGHDALRRRPAGLTTAPVGTGAGGVRLTSSHPDPGPGRSAS